MLAIRLMERLMEDHADALATRFKLKDHTLRGVPLLEEACPRAWLAAPRRRMRHGPWCGSHSG